MSLSQCNFCQWDQSGQNVPAVDILGGNLILQGCRFSRDKAHVHLGPDVLSAAIIGNQFRARQQIQNESTGDVQMMGNVVTQ